MNIIVPKGVNNNRQTISHSKTEKQQSEIDALHSKQKIVKPI